jgi:hypothetical protein
VTVPADELKTLVKEEQEVADRGVTFRPARTGGTPGSHPVGRDMTDPKLHGPKAQGGPIERIHVEPVGSPRGAIDSAGEWREPTRQNEKPAPSYLGSQAGFPKIVDVINWAELPLIDALRHKGDKITEAAEMLAAAGLDDLAVKALDSIEYTPLEKEVLLLVKRCNE